MLSVKLEKFEGPLDLLLHLIDRNKVSIYDIPIAEITEQYMEAIRDVDTNDMDLASDFLVMAATLLEIKSRMLLPAETTEDGEELDPREELVARLIEYKMYKSLSEELLSRTDEAGRVLYKEASIPEEVRKYEPPVDLDKLTEGVTLKKLQDVFWMVMKRQVDKIDPIRSRFGNIERDPVRISDRLAYVFDYGKKHKVFSFRDLLSRQQSRTGIVVTFLACLEMIHIGRIRVSQDTIFGDIRFEWDDSCHTTISKEDMEAYD